MSTLIIPWSQTSAVTFEYQGITITVDAPRYNKYIGWVGGTSSEVLVNKGVPLYGGVDLAAIFADLPTNIFIFNKEDFTIDITNLDSMVAYSFLEDA